MTLNLKKIHAGYYSKTIDGIEVTVSASKKEWQLTVFNHKEIEDDKFVLLNEWFKTKKEAYKFGTNWINTEL